MPLFKFDSANARRQKASHYLNLGLVLAATLALLHAISGSTVSIAAVLSFIGLLAAVFWQFMADVERREKEARASENRLRQLIGLMPVAVYTCDAEGRISFFNRRAAELWGREPEIGSDDQKFCGAFQLWRKDGSLLPHARTPMAVAIKNGLAARNQEVIIQRPDDSRITVSVNVDPLYDANGRLCGAINVFQDITEKEKADERIRENERHLRELIEALPAAVFTTDAEGRITAYNQEAVRFSGRIPRIGSDSWCVSWKLFRPDGTLMPHHECPMAMALKTGKAIRGVESIAEKPDGSRIHFIPYPTPIRDSRGQTVGAVNMLVDITERKEFEQRLTQANEELKNLTVHLENRVQQRTHQLEEQSEQLRRLALELIEAEEHQRKRLAQILHDHLQQFLIAAKMKLHLLGKKAGYSDGMREAESFIEQAYDASRSLTAELRPPVLYEGGLGPAFRFLARKFYSQYKFIVNLSIGPDSEPAANHFKTMIYQSVQEILMNTVKYAGVQECFVKLDRLPNHDICVVVWDHGAGFDPKNIGKKGCGGFGLFSIRERVKALGGVFRIESEPGNGAKFEMQIPDAAKTAFSSAAPVVQRVVAEKKKTVKKGGTITVLLADDHKIIRQSIATLLSSQPFIHQVVEADDGRDAVEKAGEMNPDVVMMDLNMPNMNGIEATRILHRTHPEIKIIGLSVQAEPETIQAMKDAGAVEYFSKNVDINELIAALSHLAETEVASKSA